MPNVSSTNLSLDCIEGEVWKDVVGYEGLYMVSNMGRVYAIKRFIVNTKGVLRKAGESLLKPSLTKKGYNHTTLTKNSIPTTIKTHRIVAKAFIENPHNKEQVNHINGVKTDNRVENLEWCTHTENQVHAYKTGLNKAKKGKDAINYGKVRGLATRTKLTLDTNTGIFYDCVKDAADAKCISYNVAINKLRGITYNNTGLIYV